MFWGTIHRMILGELLKVFFLALIGLTSIIMVAGVISEAMKNGFGPSQIVAIVPLLLPSLLPYTVPTTTLFATCIVYGRLSSDNEILALKAAGIHIFHVVWPAVFLGMATCIVTMLCYVHLIPYSGYLLRSTAIGDAEELLYAMLRKDGYIKHPNISVEIHVQAIQGKKLVDVIFKKKAPGRPGEWDLIAIAREAELMVDLSHKQILVDMRQCQIQQGGGAGSGFIENKIWPVELPAEFLGNPVKTRAMDMTLMEMLEKYETVRREKEKFGIELDAAQMRVRRDGESAKQVDRDLVERLTNDRRIRDEMLFSLDAEWHMRPALAFGCVCFALVGCPIGIWFSKSDYLSAFITCFLPIVVFYYPAMFCFNNLSRAGRFPAVLGIYNADIAILLIGSILFYRLARN